MQKSQIDSTVSLELSGLIFLLREVFPYVQTWRFENELERLKILTQILRHFLDVLEISARIMKTEPTSARLILRDTCVYSLLHLDSGFTLLRYIDDFFFKVCSMSQNIHNHYFFLQ